MEDMTLEAASQLLAETAVAAREKQAGSVAEYLASLGDGISNAWGNASGAVSNAASSVGSKLKPYADKIPNEALYGAGGAAVGGLLGGLSTIGQKKKRRQILNSILTGSLAGGAIGAGGKAVYDRVKGEGTQYFKPTPPDTKDLPGLEKTLKSMGVTADKAITKPEVMAALAARGDTGAPGLLSRGLGMASTGINEGLRAYPDLRGLALTDAANSATSAGNRMLGRSSGNHTRGWTENPGTFKKLIKRYADSLPTGHEAKAKLEAFTSAANTQNARGALIGAKANRNLRNGAGNKAQQLDVAATNPVLRSEDFGAGRGHVLTEADMNSIADHGTSQGTSLIQRPFDAFSQMIAKIRGIKDPAWHKGYETVQGKPLLPSIDPTIYQETFEPTVSTKPGSIETKEFTTEPSKPAETPKSKLILPDDVVAPAPKAPSKPVLTKQVTEKPTYVDGDDLKKLMDAVENGGYSDATMAHRLKEMRSTMPEYAPQPMQEVRPRKGMGAAAQRGVQKLDHVNRSLGHKAVGRGLLYTAAGLGSDAARTWMYGTPNQSAFDQSAESHLKSFSNQ